MQFCRLYTGNDGKSHFAELDQAESSEHFLAPLAVRTLVFKNDKNRDDLLDGTPLLAGSGASPCPAPLRSVSAMERSRPLDPAMCFSPKTSPGKGIPPSRKTGCVPLPTWIKVLQPL